MNNVVDIPTRLKSLEAGLRKGGEPPTIDPMEARVLKLEGISEKTLDRLQGVDVRLTKIETRLEQFATKADLAEAKNSIIMWVVSAILLAQLLPAVLKKFGL